MNIVEEYKKLIERTYEKIFNIQRECAHEEHFQDEYKTICKKCRKVL